MKIIVLIKKAKDKFNFILQTEFFSRSKARKMALTLYDEIILLKMMVNLFHRILEKNSLIFC